jgi:hypothetical protein
MVIPVGQFEGRYCVCAVTTKFICPSLFPNVIRGMVVLSTPPVPVVMVTGAVPTWVHDPETYLRTLAVPPLVTTAFTTTTPSDVDPISTR